MNRTRTQKIALLTQVLRGDVNKLEMLKEKETYILFILHQMPKGWKEEDISVATSYHLRSGEWVTHKLTYSEMNAIAHERGIQVRTFLPHNGRSPLPPLTDRN